VPVPEQLTLYQNYPNPFNPNTTISFYLPKAMPCKVEIFNIRGQKVKTLLSGTMLSGKHSLVWNGKDESGREASSGVYFSRLITPQSTKLGKMLMVK
ncbi:MAG: T9SS type A sorting domain-containing protein, partial [Candidatus Cloacimonetes bacterium]|nr:T9SS type A sorting domain-containing protein [Candidatus Cloacimonadota bacterium]